MHQLLYGCSCSQQKKKQREGTDLHTFPLDSGGAAIFQDNRIISDGKLAKGMGAVDNDACW